MDASSGHPVLRILTPVGSGGAAAETDRIADLFSGGRSLPGVVRTGGETDRWVLRVGGTEIEFRGGAGLADGEPVRVRLVPDFLKLVMVQSSVELIGGLPLIGLREPRIDGPAWAVKRLFDLMLSVILLALASPDGGWLMKDSRLAPYAVAGGEYLELAAPEPLRERFATAARALLRAGEGLEKKLEEGAAGVTAPKPGPSPHRR